MFGKSAPAVLLLWATGASLSAQAPANLALERVARSWHSNSVASVSCALVNDGTLLSFWGSNIPTTDPQKDIGIEWSKPRTFACVRVRFYSVSYIPAVGGWRLEALSDGGWQPVDALVENAESARWTFRFDPVSAIAVRLHVEKYATSRPAVNEFEVYETEPPEPSYRRAPVLDGAFWAFHYEGWARHYKTDDALAAEVDAAHAIGLDTVILYAVTGRNANHSTAVPKTVIPPPPTTTPCMPAKARLIAVRDSSTAAGVSSDSMTSAWQKDSPCRGAGRDGKDMGADVERVGLVAE